MSGGWSCAWWTGERHHTPQCTEQSAGKRVGRVESSRDEDCTVARGRAQNQPEPTEPSQVLLPDPAAAAEAIDLLYKRLSSIYNFTCTISQTFLLREIPDTCRRSACFQKSPNLKF